MSENFDKARLEKLNRVIMKIDKTFYKQKFLMLTLKYTKNA